MDFYKKFFKNCTSSVDNSNVSISKTNDKVVNKILKTVDCCVNDGGINCSHCNWGIYKKRILYFCTFNAEKIFIIENRPNEKSFATLLPIPDNCPLEDYK